MADDNQFLARASASAARLRETQGLNMGDPVALTGERKKTHGDWMHQSGTANGLRQRMHRSGNWNHLAAHQQEALDMIITKISRIVCGNPDEPDHWDDIAGYAHLGKGGHSK